VTTTAPTAKVATGSVATGRRNPNLLRKAPTVTVDYQYLRHDLRQLAVLAPTMILLLIIAYIFLH
jgi:hypothetical protein